MLEMLPWTGPGVALQRTRSQHVHLFTSRSHRWYYRSGGGGTEAKTHIQKKHIDTFRKVIKLFELTTSWRGSWPMKSLWSGLNRQGWSLSRSRWSCQGSKWRRSTTWKTSWSAWGWSMPSVTHKATSLVGDLTRSRLETNRVLTCMQAVFNCVVSRLGNHLFAGTTMDFKCGN